MVRRTRTGFSTAVFLVMAAVLLFGAPACGQEPAVVTKVVDGDTLGVSINGKRASVRLIGIDAPESSQNDKARADSKRSGARIEVITRLGALSTGHMEGLVRPGDGVRVEFDVQRRDHYGRLLGYVYLPDGRMLNEVMVKDGYAFPMTVPPNVMHADVFLKANEQAIQERAGLYADEVR